MKAFFPVALMLLVSGCSQNATPNAMDPKVAGDAEISPLEPRFEFRAPEGFEWHDEGGAWFDKKTRTSISLAHSSDQPFQSIVKDFTKERMLTANMELVNKQVRDVDGRSTLLVQGNRLKANYPQQFSIVAFATADGTAQITAIYPATLDEASKEAISAALLNARYVEARQEPR